MGATKEKKMAQIQVGYKSLPGLKKQNNLYQVVISMNTAFT